MGSSTSLITAVISALGAVLALILDWLNKFPLFKRFILFSMLISLLFALIIDYFPRTLLTFLNNTINLKDIPSSIYTYSKSEYNNIFPYGLKLLHKSITDVNYRLDFTLPERDDADVGVAFDFDKRENLSEYTWLQVTVTLGDDDVRCHLFLRDIADNDGSVELTKSSSSIQQSSDGNKKTFKIRLDQNFENVDLALVKSIFLVTGTQQIPGRGTHYLIIHDIQFLKE